MAERDSNDVRELRLEGVGLFLMVALLCAGLVGTFFLGRWYERSSAPRTGIERLASDPLENVVAPAEAEDVDTQATAFDTIGGDTQAEPSRQATPPVEKIAKPSAPKPEPVVAQAQQQQASGADGSYYVQIAAFRDRSGADSMVKELSARGYPVRIFPEDGSAGKLYKVRVGGYGSHERAATVAAELNTKGHEGAFPTKVD